MKKKRPWIVTTLRFSPEQMAQIDDIAKEKSTRANRATRSSLIRGWVERGISEARRER